ncbi:unnamed protein product, partial [marine sediment metagenome]
AELSKQFLDKTVKVLIEGLSKKPHLNSAGSRDLPQLVGRTAEDWIVVFNAPQHLAGEFTKVKITRTSPLTLFGQLATENAKNAETKQERDAGCSALDTR